MKARAAVELRLLTPADVGLLADMSAMFGAAFQEAETYTAAPPGVEYLERLLGRDEFLAPEARRRARRLGHLRPGR